MIVQANQLEFSYLQGTRMSFPDIKITDGNHTALIGESGKGKTTLLHLLGCMLRPTAGKLIVLGADVSAYTEKQRDAFRAQHIGMVFQKPHLISSLTVMDNLRLVPFLSGKKVADDQIMSVLERLGLEEITHKKVYQISQGQAQRVSIGRAVLNAPQLLLADEPTASLDDTSCDRVLRLLLDECFKIGATLVVATHDQRVKSVIGNIWAL